MKNDRKTAVLAGTLYIIGTVAGIFSLVSTGPVLDGPDYLTRISMNPHAMVTGALLVLTMGLALALVPVVMLPILRRYNEVLAIGYVLLRGGLEGATYLALVIGWLSIPLISQGYIHASAAQAAYYQSLGDFILGAHDQIGHVLTIVFILGALMFYYVLYQSNLVPRWLSAWGLLAAIPYFLSGVLGLLSLVAPMSSVQMGLVLPLAVQEMVLAVWLIAKGFNSASVNFGSVQAVISQA